MKTHVFIHQAIFKFLEAESSCILPPPLARKRWLHSGLSVWVVLPEQRNVGVQTKLRHAALILKT